MEQQYVSPVDGIEIERADFDLVAKNAALADDRVFAELLRILPGASPVARGILPASTYQGASQSAVVTSRATADARVIINPFRAFIAAVSPATAHDAYQDIRSALFVAAGSGNLFQTQQLAAATNNRWDLVYARVDIDVDDSAVIRFVKDISENVASDSVQNTKSTTVTLAVVQGTEATAPSKPAAPSDSGSSYYIPLAYVLLKAGHSLTSTVPVNQIDEVAPVINLSRATGAATVRVANQVNSEGGLAKTNEPWTVAAGRPRAYLPATMTGEEKVLLPLHLAGAHPTISPSSSAVVDDSIDWRNRYVRVRVIWCKADAGSLLPWNSDVVSPPYALFGGLPEGLATDQGSLAFNGQTWRDDDSGGGSILARLNAATTSGSLASPKLVELFVDLSTGKLNVKVGATDPDSDFLFIIEASAQFNNAF